MGEPGKVTKKDVYESYLRFHRDTETLTWNRFYIFLVFNSILVVSWATLWPSATRALSDGVYWSLAVLGILSGLVWAALGYRGRRAVYKYGEWARGMEKEDDLWGADVRNDKNQVDAKYMPMTRALELGERLRWKNAGSSRVLVYGPLFMALLHAVMLVCAMGWWCF